MLSERNTLIDGEWLDVIPADDRGFLFGDHVFETMQCTGQAMPLWPLHQERLQASGQALGIKLPAWNQLEHDLDRLMGLGPGIIRLTLTRGSSATGYWIPEGITTRRIMQWRPLPADLASIRIEGLSVYTADLRLPKPEGLSWESLKHGNRLMQVRLADDCQRSGQQEALIYRSDGHLAEAIASSVLLFKDHQWLTPRHPEVAGVGLAWLQAKGVEIRADDVTRSVVDQADEIILVNAALGPRGVSTLDGMEKVLGDGYQQLLSIWKSALL